MFGVTESVGRAYDLAVYGGKLFIPDYEGDVVRRAALGTLAPEASRPARSRWSRSRRGRSTAPGTRARLRFAR